MNKLKIRLSLVALLCLLSLPLYANNSVTLAKDWSFSWVFKEDTIEFTMTAPTKGWISLGFNPSRRMKDADYILAYIKDGEVFISDEYGTGSTSHKADVSLGGEASAKALSFKEEAKKTTITFSMPLDSGDRYDTVFVQGEQCKVLAAYANSKNFTSRHRKRESVVVTL